MCKLYKNGAEAWPIAREAGGRRPVLEKVIVEGEIPAGHGVVHLTPDQARYLRSRLTQITLAFLHENVWGGEDAHAQ
jgi:hypothetical protein